MAVTEKTRAIDQAILPLTNNQKVNRFLDSVQKTMKVDSANEAAYNQAAGDLLAARHILIGFKNPGVPATQAEKDSLKKKADMVRAQVTNANFAEMVKKYSTDPTAAQNQGNLGVFPKQMMIAAFSNATAALKPVEISQPIEREHDVRVFCSLRCIEMTGNESDCLRVRVGGNQTKSKVIVTERLHALDIRFYLRPGDIGILSKRAIDACPARLGCEIRLRGQCFLNPHGAVLPANSFRKLPR